MVLWEEYKRHVDQIAAVDQDMIVSLFAQFAHARTHLPLVDKSLYLAPEG